MRAHPSPNLLAQAALPIATGTHLVSDITYIPTREGWLYLAVVIDLYSRAILGWKIADSLHAEVVTGALRRALHTGHVAPGAIFHSDRGCQYTAASTRDILHKHELRQSMSTAGYCYDNAFAESAFASLKAELPNADQPFPSKQAARTALFDYIEPERSEDRLPKAARRARRSRVKPSTTVADATQPLAASLPSIISKSTPQP